MRKEHPDMRVREAEGCRETNSHESIPCLIRGEAEILSSMCAGAPLAQLLDRICSALDCEIWNVVSAVSVLHTNAMDFADLAESARRFGLHVFCTLGVMAENGELVGILETYSCEPRLPTAWERKLIEHASSLAAIAIEREIRHILSGNEFASENRITRESLEKWRETVN
jgi:hypothetical protein